MIKPLISAKKIHKSYLFPSTLQVLSGVEIEAFAGSSLAIMGRSGSGKSTLLHILGALESFDEGVLEIQGEKVTHANGAAIRSEKIGFVFQSCHLLEDFTVLE